MRSTRTKGVSRRQERAVERIQRQEGQMTRVRAAVIAILGLAIGLAAAPGAAASFGVEPASFTTTALERDGTVDTRAGSHPYEYTVGFVMNSNGKEIEGNLRDVEANLPKGLVGNPLAVARCSRAQFDTGFETACPGTTQVGVLNALVDGIAIHAPVFNLVPPPGVLARIGVQVIGLSAIQDVSVATGAGYGVIVDANNIPSPGIGSISETIWGVPYDPGHDPERRCLIEGQEKTGCSLGQEVVPRPFLTLPSSCTGPLSTTLKVDSTETPGVFPANALTETALSRDNGGNPVGLAGCERLSFEPTFTATPVIAGGAQSTETPSGLNVELRIPQPESPEGLNEANVREGVVKLPPGMTVSPSAANGLGACSLAQIGLDSAEPAACPDSSKLGTVEVEAPSVEHPLKGSVFLAQQGDLPGAGSNPFSSLLAIYLVAEGEGVVAKIPGKIELDEATGQITARFGGVRDSVTGEESLPELPFSDLKMTFFGGARASLVTPSACGTYTTSALLTPYGNDPGVGPLSPPVSSSSSFTINQGCTHGFSPSFAAGTINNQAGAFSPFVLSFSRHDGEQRLLTLATTLPPGLLAKLAGVERCSDADANAGTCPEGSRLGTVTASAGPGPEPVIVTGKVFLTGPYNGGPFGEVVVVPAIAGPFNLGTVVVRGSIRVDPVTAQATVVSDPFPTILKGVPLDEKSVKVTLDRPGFTFNPTSCTPQAVTATIGSTSGASAAVSSPFQAVNCATLPFKPSFSATTAGNGNFHGASLDVKIAQKPGEAAIRKVDTQLPLALPSRLVTLQKACTEAQFNTNPAGCPAGANIGTATAITPVLNVPLTGPAYLVSHGSAAFPDLDIILQGEGVKIVLVGNTDIKKGITYSRFETVPDAPISSFELKLPGGPGAVLAATKNLCAPAKSVTVTKHVTRRVHGHVRHLTVKVKKSIPDPLLMPTTITGQNGAVTQQNVKIGVTGCAKPKPKAKANKHHKPAHHKKK
jgi:hypothetical protein